MLPTTLSSATEIAVSRDFEVWWDGNLDGGAKAERDEEADMTGSEFDGSADTGDFGSWKEAISTKSRALAGIG